MSADSKTDITLQPQPSEPEIQFILDAIAEYLTVAVRRLNTAALLLHDWHTKLMMLVSFPCFSRRIHAAVMSWICAAAATQLVTEPFVNPPCQVRRADVTSAWSGIRPLAIDPKAKDTASALRDHIVVKDDDGLITITGPMLV